MISRLHRCTEERQRITEEIAKQEKKDRADQPVQVDSQQKGFPRVVSEALLKLLAGLGDLGPAPPPPGAVPIGKTYRHDADVANSKWPVIEVSNPLKDVADFRNFPTNVRCLTSSRQVSANSWSRKISTSTVKKVSSKPSGYKSL